MGGRVKAPSEHRFPDVGNASPSGKANAVGAGARGRSRPAPSRPANFPHRLGLPSITSAVPSCHGVSGKGVGPVASALKVAAPHLTTIMRRAGGTFLAARVFQVITYGDSISAHGSQAMPVWGAPLRLGRWIDDHCSRLAWCEP